jgi:hypothetical protein
MALLGESTCRKSALDAQVLPKECPTETQRYGLFPGTKNRRVHSGGSSIKYYSQYSSGLTLVMMINRGTQRAEPVNEKSDRSFSRQSVCAHRFTWQVPLHTQGLANLSDGA